jgi:hypothetical protein
MLRGYHDIAVLPVLVGIYKGRSGLLFCESVCVDELAFPDFREMKARVLEVTVTIYR